MKYFITLAICSIFIVSCGKETTDSKEDTAASKIEVTKASSKSVRGHFFDQPYECMRVHTSTSKRTGKKITLNMTSYFSPQKGWRIDLLPLIPGRGAANLHTPQTRYDGAYKDKNGEITSLKFGSAWPRKEPKPNVAKSNLPKFKKKNCKLLADASVFDFDYLDTLEVMGQ